MGGSRGGWGQGGGEKGVLFLQANLSSISLPILPHPTPPFFLKTSPQRGVFRNKVCIQTSADSLCLLELFRITAIFFSLPAFSSSNLYLKERSNLFPLVKSLANWFLLRQKHALILLKPKRGENIYRCVRRLYKDRFAQVRSRQSWSTEGQSPRWCSHLPRDRNGFDNAPWQKHVDLPA